MDVKSIPVFGSLIQQNPVVAGSNPVVTVPGTHAGQPAKLQLDADTLSKHMMLIGGTGCGKSNVFYHLVSQIKKKMTQNDVMIIFDSKGDYYDEFCGAGDLVLGGGRFAGVSEKWNLFREIQADGWELQELETNAQEMSWSVFRKSIEESKDPFFPNAARDLFFAILMCMLSEGKNDKEYRNDCLCNLELKRAFDEATILDVKAMIESHPEYASVLSYLGDGTSGQALGVYAEMLGVVRRILTSSFSEKGLFSVRHFVRERQGKTLFIEYDLAIGNTLSTIYSLLIDLALKETLGRGSHAGNVYIICDEFRLIPYLQHIDDAVNFGRSLGIKLIAGLQSINQLYEVYGEPRGKNILAGFSSIFAFKANDAFTRDYISSFLGKSIVIDQYKTLAGSIREEKREAHVVEDWQINSLSVGEAVISLAFRNPFLFRFGLYSGRRA